MSLLDLVRAWKASGLKEPQAVIPGMVNILDESVLLGYLANMEASTRFTRGTVAKAKTAIANTGYASFRKYWKWLRLRIGLQQRLLVEQILLDLGKPWSLLVTGFKPIG